MGPYIFLICLTHSRESCKIEMSGKHVVKRYTCHRDGEAWIKVLKLEAHYRLLQTRHVPNVDQLLYAHGTTVVLTPRGIARQKPNFGSACLVYSRLSSYAFQ